MRKTNFHHADSDFPCIMEKIDEVVIYIVSKGPEMESSSSQKTTTGIFSNKWYRGSAILAGILVLVYVLINLFVIGGDGFVINLNNLVAPLLAILTTVFAALLFLQLRANVRSRILWGGLLAGWALWAIAETLWFIFGYLGQEVPYPSIADLFWLAGYIPLGVGLYSRLREMPLKLTGLQKLVLWGGSLLTIFITIAFVILPVFRQYDASNQLASIISIIYPLADLILLVSVLRLLFVYRSGDYGHGWNMLITGFVLMTVADLVFAYATPLGLYYPDQKANLISTLGNSVPYNLSYLVWIFGIYALLLVLREQHPLEIDPVQPELVPNVHMLVCTKNDDTIVDVSDNFGVLFEFDQGKVKSLAELLQVPRETVQPIIDNIRSGENTERCIAVKNRSGLTQDVFICGMAIFSLQREYTGENLLLRTLAESDYTLDDRLDEQQKSIVHYLLQKCSNAEEIGIKKLLIDYYLAFFKRLYNFVYQTGGGHMGLLFQENLKQTARERQWQFQFDPQSPPNYADYSLGLLREELPVLLESARRFATQLTDAKSVETEMQLISAQFSEAFHKNLAYYSESVR